jgi:segregation and condensation protein B
MEPERLKPILEAALLASPHPMTPVQLADLFDEFERPTLDAIGHSLHALAEDCAGRGVELVEVGSGFRYQVRVEIFPHISALWTERQSRYSRALLETISLIAYRQPITRGEIEQIRGVAVATSILRTLEEREWVRVVGHRDVPGKPALYGTTRAFLDYFQLKSLDELPPLSALRDLDAIDPQLGFEVGPGPLPAATNDIDDVGADEASAARDETDVMAAEAAARQGGDGEDDVDPDALSGIDPDDIDETVPGRTGEFDDHASETPSVDDDDEHDEATAEETLVDNDTDDVTGPVTRD